MKIRVFFKKEHSDGSCIHRQSHSEFVAHSLFLAGPSPRDPGLYAESWRREAIKILEKLHFQGVVFVPLKEDGGWLKDGDRQLDWETRFLRCVDCIVMWCCRDLEKLPGFTTNIEFGEYYGSHRAVYGRPPNTPKTGVFDYHAKQEMRYRTQQTLPGTLEDAVDSVNRLAASMMPSTKFGSGPMRVGVETELPLGIWCTPEFQGWYKQLTLQGDHLKSINRHVILSTAPQSGAATKFIVELTTRDKYGSPTNQTLFCSKNHFSVTIG